MSINDLFGVFLSLLFRNDLFGLFLSLLSRSDIFGVFLSLQDIYSFPIKKRVGYIILFPIKKGWDITNFNPLKQCGIYHPFSIKKVRDLSLFLSLTKDGIHNPCLYLKKRAGYIILFPIKKITDNHPLPQLKKISVYAVRETSPA